MIEERGERREGWGEGEMERAGERTASSSIRGSAHWYLLKHQHLLRKPRLRHGPSSQKHPCGPSHLHEHLQTT